MTRLEGELKRFRLEAECMRALLISLEDLIADELPSSSQRQAVTMSAARLSNYAAVIDSLREEAA